MKPIGVYLRRLEERSIKEHRRDEPHITTTMSWRRNTYREWEWTSQEEVSIHTAEITAKTNNERDIKKRELEMSNIYTDSLSLMLAIANNKKSSNIKWDIWYTSRSP